MPFEKVSSKTLEKWGRKAASGNVAYRMKLTNYYRQCWNEYSEEEGSTMIHERDYTPMKCCLCGKEMNSIHDTHNPAPLAPHTYAKQAQEENSPHRCCGQCNAEKVNPARMVSAGKERMIMPLIDMLEIQSAGYSGYKRVGEPVMMPLKQIKTQRFEYKGFGN